MPINNKKFFSTIIFLFISIFSLPTNAATTKSSIITQWVEIGPNNNIIVRALTTQSSCPIIKLKHQKIINMTLRQNANTDFPFSVCEALLSATDENATINGIKLAIPHSEITKIVIIGDTGCSIKNSSDPQACDNSKKWPFATIIAHAAAWKPDLVIHVGDYLYREKQCPANFPGCKGSPFGDNWNGWQADFFKPAKPLLKTAPWVFVRGNHETCERAGIGWTLLLNPFPITSCQQHEPLYQLTINNTTLFIMDSAYASDMTAPSLEVDRYNEDMKLINDYPAVHKWIITHKPFWFVYDDGQLTRALQSHFMNTLQTAWSDIKPNNIDAFFSGHVHRFQTINFQQPGRPPQIIVGASGARLNTRLGNVSLAGFNLAGDDISQGISLVNFGYLTLEKQKDFWSAQIRNPTGKILANCILQNKQFICQETKLAKMLPVEK